MIDYIQIKFVHKYFDNWFYPIKSEFKEIPTKRDKYFVKRFKNLVVEVYPKSKTIKVEGSLHRYFNGGTHNHNDFDRVALYDTIVEVCQILNTAPQNAHIHGIEFGINVRTPFNPSFVLEHLLSLNTETAKKDQEFYFDFYEFDFAKYRFKIYNKSQQHKLDFDLLRVEVHVKKMQWLASKGSLLKTLEDLQQLQHLQKLGEILINCFDEIIIAEPLETSTMTAKDAHQYEQLIKLDSWVKIAPLQRFRQKEKFERIIDQYVKGVTLKEILRGFILQKWNELLSISGVEDLKRLYQVGTTDNQTPNLQKCNDSTEWENTPPRAESEMIVPLEIKGTIISITTNNLVLKKCANCRKVLLVENSKYCDSRCKEMKDKRNNKSNPMHDTKRKVLKIVANPNPPLFEQREFIKIDQRHAQWLENFGVMV
jgi:hypothetical protein